MRWIVLAAALTVGAAWGQEEERGSNRDLRGTNPLFSLQKGQEQVGLVRGAADEFFLEHSDKGGPTRHKVARARAQELDQQFSAAFLKLQYELPADPAGCKAEWRMVLRGEEIRFCEVNEQKHRAIGPLFAALLQAARP